MSGIIGHVMYAVLGAKAAAQRQLPLAPLIARHWSSYLAGSYLGCDIQTMPEAICVDTGKEVGYGTVPLSKSPLTGGKVRPFYLDFAGHQYRPTDIHEAFYGRAHLTFGWSKAERALVLPWEHLPDYCAAVVGDTLDLYGPGERPLAYVLGWMAHLIGDGLIKSIWPGVTLHLLDGKYTARNRPIQDLFTYHEVGIKELRLNWPSLLADLAETPSEDVQLHYMRVAPPRGRLAQYVPAGWQPSRAGLLRAVFQENRRYLKLYQRQVIAELALTRANGEWRCQPALEQASGGLTYPQMVEAAEKAQLPLALRQIAEAIADLFGQVVILAPQLRELPGGDRPNWEELTRRWNAHAQKSYE